MAILFYPFGALEKRNIARRNKQIKGLKLNYLGQSLE